MNKIEATSADALAQLLNEHPRALVDFYKDNCPGCKMLDLSLGKFESTAAAQDMTLIKVKLETVGEALFLQYGLRQTPSLLHFADGTEVGRLSGFVPPAQIEALVSA